MIDIHAHFAGEEIDFSQEWAKIQSAGVRRVILAGDSLKNCIIHADLAKSSNGCYFTVGIHPEFAESAQNDFPVEELFALGKEEKCVAVGEIGLDYHYSGEGRRAQISLFEKQLDLADRLALPVQIHSRDACADTLSVLREHPPKYGFCMHCYSYGADNISAFLSLGGYLSFGGTVCFKNAKKNTLAATACPLDRILTETDSPYLSPIRGERNTPANIPVIVEELARLKQIPQEELEKAVEQNAERLFFKLI